MKTLSLRQKKNEYIKSRLEEEHLHNAPTISSDQLFNQLVSLEERFGGFIKDVPRQKWSKFDPLSRSTLLKRRLQGGDRMDPKQHNYGIHYAKHLSKLINVVNISAIAEIGILMGTGVAVFADLFPFATVYGFDIDLGNINGNMEFLKERGAFKYGNLRLHEFDQYNPNLTYLENVKFDIVIDDGSHTDKPILSAFTSFYPHLKPSFLYIVEDCVCQTFRSHFKQQYKDLVIDYIGNKPNSEISFIYPKDLYL